MSRTVLLVDDDHSLRSGLRECLEDRGIEVFEAPTAAAARKFFAERDVDCALVDGRLPDGQGDELIAELAAARPGSKVRWIFASAFFWGRGVFERLTRDLGVSLVMQKPIPLNELVFQIEGLLETPRATPAPAELGERKLDVVRRRFAVELLTRLERLGEVLERATLGDEDAREELLTEAHRLHGTAGSFGFFTVSLAAARIEAALQSGSGVSVEAPAWHEIAEALAVARGAAAVGENDHPKLAETAAANPRDPTSRRVRILAVDDDRQFLERLVKLGEESMIEIVPAQREDQALVLARNERLDGILLDLQLGPDCEPERLISRLQGIEGLSQVPIAILSGHTTLGDRVGALRLGASLFVQKPLSAGRLAEVTQQLLARRQANRHRILVLDDDQSFVEGLAAVLEEEGYEVSQANRADVILEVLGEVRPDLLILDAMMPLLSGFDVCRIVRSIPEWTELPILMVTAQLGDEVRIAAFEAGADDYVPKPPHRRELLARLRVRLERVQLLRERAERDSLTGLLLRRPFVSRFDALTAQRRRRSGNLSLVLLDLDHFKQVNDHRGHVLGDRVLATFGAILSERFRTEDLVGRWGGEEFVVGLTDAPAPEALRLCRALLSSFAQLEFVDGQGRPFTVSFSGGVACFPDDGTTFDDLLRVADRRLYVGKDGGRNRIVGAEDEARMAPPAGSP